jgi:hypothetical protein
MDIVVSLGFRQCMDIAAAAAATTTITIVAAVI